MGERTSTRTAHKVHLRADARPMAISVDALDTIAEEKYFGKSVRKIAVCTECQCRHNGECY
jgi:hypothetical protein